MPAVVVVLVVVAVLALAWVSGVAWRRLSTRAAARALDAAERTHRFCESCGLQPVSDERSCRACGTPLYVSHLAGRRGG